jgi:WD40 repeat protein
VHCVQGDGKIRWTSEGHGRVLYAATFNDSGTVLATGGNDDRVLLWDSATGSLVQSIKLRNDPLVIQWISESVLAVASADSTIRVHEPRSGELIETIDCEGEIPKGLAVCSVRPGVAFVLQRGNLVLRELSTFAAIRLFEAPDCVNPPLCWRADGVLVAAGLRDRRVAVWDANTGRMKSLLVGHGGPVVGLSFLPENDRIASVSEDGTVRLWEVGSGSCIEVFTGWRDGWAASVPGVGFRGEGDLSALEFASGFRHSRATHPLIRKHLRLPVLRETQLQQFAD